MLPSIYDDKFNSNKPCWIFAIGFVPDLKRSRDGNDENPPDGNLRSNFARFFGRDAIDTDAIDTMLDSAFKKELRSQEVQYIEMMEQETDNRRDDFMDLENEGEGPSDSKSIFKSYEKNSKQQKSLEDALKLLEAHVIRAKRALDVGSYNGYMTLAFAKMMEKPGAVVYRIETNSSLRDEVKANIEKNHWEYMATGKIVLAEGYFANVEKADVTYDAIYVKSASSIEMDALTDEISNKFVGQLANGGRMVISRILELLVVDKDEDGRITKQLKQHPSKIKPSKEFNQTSSQIKASITTKCHRAPDEILKCMVLKGGALKRISGEINHFFNDPPQDIFLESGSGNQVFGRFNGPHGSPFEGGVFKFVVEFQEEHPYKPPKINLLTRIFHPNISCSSGIVCMDILMDNWTPALTLIKIVLSTVSLLTSPNTDDAFEPEIACLYFEDKARYEAIAREWTLKYAV